MPLFLFWMISLSFGPGQHSEQGKDLCFCSKFRNSTPTEIFSEACIPLRQKDDEFPQGFMDGASHTVLLLVGEVPWVLANLGSPGEPLCTCSTFSLSSLESLMKQSRTPGCFPGYKPFLYSLFLVCRIQTSFSLPCLPWDQRADSNSCSPVCGSRSST